MRQYQRGATRSTGVLGRINGLFFRVGIFIVLGASHFPLLAQPLVWRNDWLGQQPPSLANYFPGIASLVPGSAPIAFGPNADILLGGNSLSFDDIQVVRMDSSGAIRWSTNFTATVDSAFVGTGTLIATEDGGALLTLGDFSVASGTAIARVNPDGTIRWLSKVQAGQLARPSSQVDVTSGCSTVTAFDDTTGQTLWQYSVSYDRHCTGGGITADGMGNVYAIFPKPATTAPVPGFQVIKFNAPGHVVWSRDFSQPTTLATTPVYASASLLFVNTDTGLSALRTSDGSTAWDSPGATAEGFAGNPSEPVVVQADTIQRLRTEDGQPLWSTAINQYPIFVSAPGSLILVGGNDGALSRIDPQTGSVLWSTKLPTKDANDNDLNFFAVESIDAATLLVTAQSTNFTYGAPPVFLQRVQAESGQLLTSATASNIAQGAGYFGTSLQENDGHVVTAASSRGTTSPWIRIRRIDGNGGQQLWESTQPLSANPASLDITSANGVAVVGSAQIQGDAPNSAGSVWVGAFDEQDGHLIWQRTYQQIGQLRTYASAPVIDASGNVYIAYGTYVSCQQFPNYGFCPQQSLLKLAAANGDVLWQHDAFSTTYLSSGPVQQVFAQNFSLLGADVVLTGTLVPQVPGHDLVALSSTDGSEQWTSDLFAGKGAYGTFPSNDGNFIALGFGAWSKIDPGTGNALWSNPSIPFDCQAVCNIYANLEMPNDDIYYVGEADWKPYVKRVPASQGAAEQVWRLEPNDASLRSDVTEISKDAAGHIWFRLNRTLRGGTSGVAFLAEFDPTTGTLTRQQALDAYGINPLTASINPVLLGAPESNLLTLLTFPQFAPAPTTIGNAQIDTTPVQNGDLSIAVTTDRAKVSAGDVLMFHFVVSYSGNAPISGAHMFAELPWTSIAAGVACQVQSAANCIIDNRSQTLYATFDIQPGGQVDVSGQVLVSGGLDTPQLLATVYGPTGLVEQNTINNFSRAALTQDIFANGFD